MTANGGSIRLSFQYRGVRCRETIALPPTKRNLAWAGAQLRRIHDEIALGSFDYAEHFPDSHRARLWSPAALTVGKALDAWLEGHRPHITAGTRRQYTHAIERHLWPRIGQVELPALTVSACKRMIADMSQTLSPKSINNILIPLRRMLAEAASDEVIPRSPMDLVTNLKTTTEEPDPFTPDEAAAVLRAITEPQVRNLYQFALWTGLRPSELIVLRWGDVDWKAGVVRVRRARVQGEVKTTKTQAGRRDVKLLPAALEALTAQKAHTYLARDVVFVNPRTRRPWISDKAMRETHWNHALTKAGVRARAPYQCRHTFASWMLSAGENPVWVSRMMGHTSPVMTFKVYGRWIPDVDPTAGDKAANLSAFGPESGQEAS